MNFYSIKILKKNQASTGVGQSHSQGTMPSRSGNMKCNLAKRAWVAYWPYSEQCYTLASMSFNPGNRQQVKTRRTEHSELGW